MHIRRSTTLAVGVASVLAVGAFAPLASASTAPTGTASAGSGGGGGDCVVGVSWNNFQEERWAKWDEPAIKDALEAGGGSYISNDAKSSAETQASNVENLISQGANVLIILAQDGTAIRPSVASAARQRHPGHRLRPPDRGSRRAVHHVRQRRGRTHAGARDLRPRSRRATTSSSRATRPTPTPTSCAAATRTSSVTPSTAGDIKIVGETYTDNWDAAQGADRDGAVPDGEQQRRPGRALRERRHGRRRRRRPRGPGPRRPGAGLGPGRRPRRP